MVRSGPVHLDLVRPWLLPIIVLLVLFLHGCSAVRLGYGQADGFSRWWIDQYIDMSSGQENLVRVRLARFHAWHRKTQLDDYAALARQAQKLVAGKPTVAEVLALGNDIIRRGRTLAEQATPDIADLLLTLKPEQIERMARRIEDKNADHAKEIRLAEGESGQHKARYKRLLERAEYWLDDLSDEQKEILRLQVESRPQGIQFWYDERLRRQRDWLALVRQVQRERPPRESVMSTLRSYAARFDLPEDPARLTQALALRRVTAEITVALIASATPEQRAHARHKLDDLGRDFSELAREIQAN